MKKSLIIFSLIEATPLPIFLFFSAFIDQSINQNWQGPFVASSIVAILTTTVLLWNRIRLNRLFIGINLYLLIGTVALLTHHVWLNHMYEILKASGMLAGILIVGTCSLLFSPAGFIGISSQDRKQVIIFSLYLLLITGIAFLFSLYFQGNKILSQFIPFIALFSAQRKLQTSMIQATANPIT